jgi:hypothetical protein
VCFYKRCVLFVTLFSLAPLERKRTLYQGIFFWLQNKEGEPLVGVFATNHQPQVLLPYFVARKKNPALYCHFCDLVQLTSLTFVDATQTSKHLLLFLLKQMAFIPICETNNIKTSLNGEKKLTHAVNP